MELAQSLCAHVGVFGLHQFHPTIQQHAGYSKLPIGVNVCPVQGVL